jgi:ankyrin repeat protein
MCYHIDTQLFMSSCIKAIVQAELDALIGEIAGASAVPKNQADLERAKDVIEVLLDAGTDVNSRVFNGATALSFAVRHGYPELAKLLIAKGADVNLADEKGVTPLHLAVIAHGRSLGNLHLLVDAGADPLAEDAEGRTPGDLKTDLQRAWSKPA